MRRSLLLALILVGCGSEPAQRAEPQARQPPRRPDGITLTLAVHDLGASAEEARRLAGPLLGRLGAPIDPRAIVLGLAGLEPSAVRSIDPHGDLFVVGLGDPSELAVGLPLIAGAERPALAPGERRSTVVEGSTLVVAPDAATARALAPFIGRVLAREHLEHAVHIEVQGAALHALEAAILSSATDLAAELRADVRAVRSEMRREPEIGEPEAVVDWIEQLGRGIANEIGGAALRLDADFGQRSVGLSAELRPSEGSSLAEQLSHGAVGDPVLLGEMSADVTAAVWLRRSERQRAEASARTLALVSRIAGERLSSREAALLLRLLGRWDREAGDQTAVGLIEHGQRLGAVLVSEANSSGPAEALRGLPALAGSGYFARVGERLGAWSGPIRELPEYRVAGASVSAHELRAPAAGPLGARWQWHVAAGAGSLRACAGDAGEVRACVSPPRGRTLLDVPVVKQLRERGHGRLTSLGVVSPSVLLRLLATLGGPRWQRLADPFVGAGAREPFAWSIGTDTGRMLIDVLLPRAALGASLELVQ